MYLQNKNVDLTQNLHTSFKWPWTCQNHHGTKPNILSGHMHSFGEVKTSNVSFSRAEQVKETLKKPKKTKKRQSYWWIFIRKYLLV